MHDAAFPPSRLSPSRLTPWLAAALLLHALLLLAPARHAVKPGAFLHSLNVSLQSTGHARPAAERPPAPATRKIPAVPEARPPGAAGSARKPEQARPAEPVAPAVPRPSLSAAELLDSARRQEWQLPGPAPKRELGVYAPHPAPLRPGSAPGKNLFDGMVLPDAVEVVDRWLAADGSHNVVIQTPGGETYCGRVEAWNPMNPLYEPIMMFRSCGGGGKRTFDMPPVYRGKDSRDR